MPSTFTLSKVLELVPRGGDPGTWDAPENSNWQIVDSALGGIAAINITGSGNIVLSAAQFQSSIIMFTGTLSGSISVTFPTSFYGPYKIANFAVSSPPYNITLGTTAAASQVIGCRPQETFEVYNDGANLRHTGLPPVGTYWDYAGTAVPGWVSACTVPPFLNCDGTIFSAVTYPALNAILGGNVLPDSRGRYRHTLDQGVGRVTNQSSISGPNGSVVGSGGGDQQDLIYPWFMPTMSLTISDPGHQHLFPGQLNAMTPGSYPIYTVAGARNVNGNTDSNTTGITASIPSAGNVAQTYGNYAHTNFPPVYIGGITMIRAGG